MADLRARAGEVRMVDREPARDDGPPELKGVYRYQVDVVVFAADQKEADERIRIQHPALVRSVIWTTIRQPDGWTNPAWRVTQEGEMVTVELKSKRRRNVG